MRCRVCNYQLWNLEARRCPECGTPFLPSQYELAPNRVCFCCPHCGQSYYGAGDKGHLVPRDFDCVTCARHVDMDDMILRPAEGFDTDDTAGARVPWLDRRRRGFWRGWLGTIGMALVKPGRLGTLLPAGSPLLSAAAFAMLTIVLIWTAAILVFAPFALLSAAGVGGNTGPGWGEMLFAVSVTILLVLAFAVTAVFAGIGLWSLVSHGLLRLTGPTREGLGRSFSCLCYASGAYVLTAIPCFGPYVGWIWWLVSSVVTVREGQRVSGARAAFAVLTPPLLVIGSVVALYIWLLTMAFTSASGMTVTQPSLASDNLSNQVLALKRYADSHNGWMPVHSLHLLANGDLTADEFVTADSPTMTEDVTIGEETLEDLQYLPEDQLDAAVQAAADRLQAGVVAHRVGDYVFTYHGINLKSASNMLWLVIESPEPNQTGAGADRTFRVIGADGTIRAHPARAFDTALADQNKWRRFSRLPPLPHPDTVTPDRPAAAPQSTRDW